MPTTDRADGALRVVAVCRDSEHQFSKPVVDSILLLDGLGVAGDAHAGATVQHRSRDSTQPNLRQVHLISAELHADLSAKGFQVGPGQLGENITTGGLDLLALPRGTMIHLGPRAVVEITGLRNPCRQIDAFRPGMLSAVLYRDERGQLVRKVGIMGVVRQGGAVQAGDPIKVEIPEDATAALEVV